jgi:hypothetical protein
MLSLGLIFGLHRGTATVMTGDAGCTRAQSFVAVSILGDARPRREAEIQRPTSPE